MSATTISLAALVVGVVPVDVVALELAFVAVTSSGELVDPPLTSITVMVIAEAEGVVTRTLPDGRIDVELAAYHISPSACEPRCTAAALAHTFPTLSLTLVTVTVAVTLRTRTTATRRSPDVVATLGEALSWLPAVVRAALKLCTTPSDAEAGRAKRAADPLAHTTVTTRISPDTTTLPMRLR